MPLENIQGSPFPESFIWGVSTSGHQTEGENKNSDFWVLENMEDSPFIEPSGKAIGHFKQFESDIALLAALGTKAYRFSLEWCRIEPEHGVFSQDALDHYARVLDCCWAHQITPIVTFNHFTIPIWFATHGGWLAPNAADLFANFVEVSARQLGERIGIACTLNEPNIVVQQAVVANRQGRPSNTDAALMHRAAGAVNSEQFYSFFFVDGLEVRDTLLRAHRRAYDVLKSGPGDFPVGLCLNLRDYQLEEHSRDAEDWRNAFVQEGHVAFYDAARGDDFVGVQYYSRRRVGAQGIVQPPEETKLTQMREEDYPDGLENVIGEAAYYSKCPVIVTENGVPTETDEDRVTYINKAIRGVANAISSGIDVRGYIYWSAFDNYEWMDGFRPKFGLIGVDRETQKRRPKPSAYHYQSIISSNGQRALD